MPNPTSLTDKPAVLQATTTEDSVQLQSDREYSIGHDGEQNDGTADSNTIYLSFVADVDADESEGADKAKLISGRSLVVGPGVAVLKFATEAGSPTMTVVPGPRKMGMY